MPFNVIVDLALYHMTAISQLMENANGKTSFKVFYSDIGCLHFGL